MSTIDFRINQSSMKAEIHYLATIKAPDEIFGQRNISEGTKVHDAIFWDRYDHETLIYDSVWLPKQKKMRMFLPKLINFKDKIMNAYFFSNERAVEPKLQQFRRFDIIEWSADFAPQNVYFMINGMKVDVPVSNCMVSSFKDCNVIYTMIKNDNLTWVYDWVLAHQKNHGANAVLIINNGSTSYSSRDLLDTISRVPGVRSAHVIDVPIPYGPPDASYSAPIGLEFLQTACLNLVRDRFLNQARAVLVCDIDEIITSKVGQSIFDVTAQSLMKYRLIKGSWRYSKATDEVPRHSDHILIDHSQKQCQPKYCIVPDSVLGRMCWSVHSLENVNRRIFRPNNQFSFFHCYSISTSWKTKRDTTGVYANAVTDSHAGEFMKRTFTET